MNVLIVCAVSRSSIYINTTYASHSHGLAKQINAQ